jgi:hypothetical protein
MSAAARCGPIRSRRFAQFIADFMLTGAGHPSGARRPIEIAPSRASSIIDGLAGRNIRTANWRRSRRVVARPDHLGVKAGGGEPSDLAVYSARLVIPFVDWGGDIGRIVTCHEIAEHEPSARP